MSREGDYSDDLLFTRRYSLPTIAGCLELQVCTLRLIAQWHHFALGRLDRYSASSSVPVRLALRIKR
jgi:hypothetical protein